MYLHSAPNIYKMRYTILINIKIKRYKERKYFFIKKKSTQIQALKSSARLEKLGKLFNKFLSNPFSNVAQNKCFPFIDADLLIILFTFHQHHLFFIEEYFINMGFVFLFIFVLKHDASQNTRNLTYFFLNLESQCSEALFRYTVESCLKIVTPRKRFSSTSIIWLELQ